MEANTQFILVIYMSTICLGSWRFDQYAKKNETSANKQRFHFLIRFSKN